MRPIYLNKSILKTGHISVVTLKNAKEINEKIRDAYQWFQDNNRLNWMQTNLTCEHTPYISHRMCEQLQPVYDEFKTHAVQYFAQTKQYRYGIDKFTECAEMWIAKYEAGHHAELHTHFPFHLAMTYYLDIDDPRPIEFEVYDPEYGWALDSIAPSEGMLVMFDGDIKHRVLPVRGNRTCVASNWYFDLAAHMKAGYDEEIDQKNIAPEEIIS